MRMTKKFNLLRVFYVASAWGSTVNFKAFVSYLLFAFHPLISERNYPASSFSWPPPDAALSISKLLFLIYTSLFIRWSPKEITQHQAFRGLRLMQHCQFQSFCFLFTCRFPSADLRKKLPNIKLFVASAWCNTFNFKAFVSYLHVAFHPLISERNYPTSSISKYEINFP